MLLVTFHVLTVEARQCSDLMLALFDLDIVIGSAAKQWKSTTAETCYGSTSIPVLSVL